jgi:hypothetical protein
MTFAQMTLVIAEIDDLAAKFFGPWPRDQADWAAIGASLSAITELEAAKSLMGTPGFSADGAMLQGLLDRLRASNVALGTGGFSGALNDAVAAARKLAGTKLTPQPAVDAPDRAARARRADFPDTARLLPKN